MPVPESDTRSTPARQTADDYWNLSDGVRAELVDGKLHEVAPPNYSHQMIAFGIAHVLRGHVDARGGPCKVVPAPFAVNLFNDRTTYLEPDVSVICDPFLSTFGTTRWRCASAICSKDRLAHPAGCRCRPGGRPLRCLTLTRDVAALPLTCPIPQPR